MREKSFKNIKWMNFAEVSTGVSGFRVALDFLDLSLLQPRERHKHSSIILFETNETQNKILQIQI